MSDDIPTDRVVLVDFPSVGQLSSLAVGDRRIALANVKGSIFAFDDECTHEHCPLSQGELEGFVVVCHCHGAEFDIRSGEPLAGPADEPIRIHRVVTEGSDIVLQVGR
jgi:nitrite reductase/ring-hydroxylating ferredoxin subunit